MAQIRERTETIVSCWNRDFRKANFQGIFQRLYLRLAEILDHLCVWGGYVETVKSASDGDQFTLDTSFFESPGVSNILIVEQIDCANTDPCWG